MDTVRSRSQVSAVWPTAQGKSIEGTYARDHGLQGRLDQLDLDEIVAHQRFLFTQPIRNRYGYALSNRDIAMSSSLPQARAQRVNEGTLSARAFANEQDTWTTIQMKNYRQHGIDFAVQSTPVDNRPTGHTCVVCLDPIQNTEIHAPCGHYYDIGCITSLFQAATRDETLYPPRCCGQNIPLSHVQSHLPKTLVTLLHQKQAEHSTHKRVYCSSPACSRFLGPQSEGTLAKTVYICPAPECRQRTCAECRAEHSGDWTHVCRPESDAAQVLALGRTAGWARCPGCSHMIELQAGCFHVTCRCRTEFCYLCGARWKTCLCPQWRERRLVVAAEERVDTQPQAPDVWVGQDMGARWHRPAPLECPIPAPVSVPAPIQERESIENSRSNPGARSAPMRVPAPGVARRPGYAPPIAVRPIQPRVNDTIRQRIGLETADRMRVELDRHHALWHYRNGWYDTCWRCRH